MDTFRIAIRALERGNYDMKILDNIPCFYISINLNLSVSSTYDIVSQEYFLEGAMLRIQY